MRAYRIKNWDKIFENSESRKLRKLNWVPIPNSWEGLGYVRVTKHKNAVSILAAWPLVIQIGSKCPYRGLLAKVDAPLSVEDMSDLTRMPAQMFERALEALMDPLIGWVDEVEIEKSEDDESWKILGIPNESPEALGESPDASGDGGVEGNGIEQKETGGKGKEDPADAVTLPPSLAAIPGFETAFTEFVRHRVKVRKPMTEYAKTLILRSLSERPNNAIAALEMAIVKGWQSIEWEWFDKNKLKTGSEKPTSKFSWKSKTA